LLYCRSIIKFK